MHQLDGSRSQDARAAQLAAAPEHLAEAQVVGSGAGQSSAAGKKRRLLQIVATLGIVNQLERLIRLPLIVSRKAIGLARGYHERSVFHVEWIEDRLLQILVEALAGDRLDQVAAHVGRERVHPSLSGLIAQRHLRELVRKPAKGLALAAPYTYFAIYAVNGMIGCAIG